MKHKHMFSLLDNSFTTVHVTFDNTVDDLPPGRYDMKVESIDYPGVASRDRARQSALHRLDRGSPEAEAMTLRTRQCRFQHPTNRQLSRLPETAEEHAIAAEWDAYVKSKAEQDERDYKFWLGRGVAKEVARTVLPEGLVPTVMYLHFSVRTWLHYIKERTAEGVQAEHRFIAEACRDELENHFPNTSEAFFGD